MDNINTALSTTFTGFTIVFIALILLSFILYLFSKLFNNKKEAKEIESSAQTPIKEEPHKDEELIAVLSAAVSAISERAPDVNFKIKSYRKVTKGTPVWNKAGRTEYLINKL
jgi:sodium pump decarboxylase gamma subunit